VALGCVVLAYGEGAGAVSVVEQLLRQGVAATSITVVHNPDRPHSSPPPLAEGVRVLGNTANLGYAGGMNRGLSEQLADGADPLLLMTQDLDIHPHAVERLLEAAGGAPGHGAIGPLLVERATGRPFSLGMRRLAGGGLAHRRGAPPQGDALWDCDALDGSALLLRADALREVGLLDESFFMYCEEADLCLRLRRAGWRLAVVPAAVVEQSSGSPGRPAAFGYLMGRNGLELAWRDAGLAGVVLGLCRHAAGTAMTLAELPSGRSHAGSELARLLGVWAGTLAFFLRRFGPPPRPLAGDIRRT
jgi:GT2 family glycosyltransferase